MVKLFPNSRYKVARKKIVEQTSAYLKEYGFTDDQIVTVVFVGKRKMEEIAARYKDERVALPVLSFSYLTDEKTEDSDNIGPASPEEKVAGEIFICYPQAILLAAEREKKVDDLMIDLIKHGIDNIVK